MKKKNVILLTVMAAFVLVAAFSYTSCNKAEVDPNVPVVYDTLLPPKGPILTTVCPHHDTTDPGRIMIIDAADPTAMVHHTHEYLEGDSCAISTCEWNGRHHIHEVYFWRGHYEDSWEHLGGSTLDD